MLSSSRGLIIANKVKSDISTRDLLAALQLPKVGPSAVRKLWASANDQAGASLLERLETVQGKRGAVLSDADVTRAYDKADEIVERSQQLKIHVLSLADSSYPSALLDVPDHPPVIYVKGNLETLANPRKMAVVGTREASELGLRLARKIASELSNLNICVVSGLALGVDTAAHEGAIRGKGSTIAVLAHGLDQVAPKSNEDLAAAILDRNGALLSEHEIGVIPRGPQFVSRNRLQSGLSRGSIVVESGFSGGSIYQGKFTTEQRRLLFVVMPDESLPGSAEFRREGGERLHKEFGARKISRLEDVWSAIPEFRAPNAALNAPEGAREPEADQETPSTHAPIHVHVHESVSAQDSYDATVKSSLAIHHLFAAEFLASKAEAVERGGDRSDEAAMQHRSYSIGAVLTAVAFLEALINDIYLSAVDGSPNSPFSDFVQTEAVANEWRNSKDSRWSLLEKYERALVASGKPGYRSTDRLRADVDSLIHLRNSLTHYKPEWDNQLKRHKDVEKRLVGKFPESAFSDRRQAFFPHRCIGAGCARWAVTVAGDFALDVREKLDLSETIPVQQALIRQKTA